MDIYSYDRHWSVEHKLEWFKTSFRSRFEIWVISPAQAMIDHPNGGMPAFVWLTCAIDWAAGFWWGKPTIEKDAKGRIKNENKKCYTGFINEYFTKDMYDADGLWDSLRNGLVHMYTIKGAKYALTNKGKRGTSSKKKRIYPLESGEFF